jgi:hypothetical protein
MKNLFVSIVIVLCGTALLLGAGGPVPPRPQILSSSSSGVAGANTQVQFNNSGAFGANAGFTYNGSASSPSVTIAGSSNSGSLNLGAGNGSAGAVLQFGQTGPTFTANASNGISSSGPFIAGGTITVLTSAFASLGAVPAAGIFKYCTDCTTAATCAGSGSGHLAVSNGTNWTCQ